MGAEYAERLAGETGNWSLIGGRLRVLLPSLQGRTYSASERTVARTLRKMGATHEAAHARNRGILEIADRDEQAVLALDACNCNRQHDQLWHLRKKLALPARRGEARGSFAARGAL